MSTNDHTPGPWSADLTDEAIRSHDGDTIATTHWSKSYVSKEQNDANARLIAAAPEILEQLRQVHMLLRNLIFDAKSNRPWSPQAADNLKLAADDTRAVIDKATGKEPA